MTKRLLAVPAALALAVVAAGCGGGSSTPAASSTTTPPASSTTPAASGTAPADPAAAKAEITANWEKFFDSHTPRAQAVALLEDGATLGAALDTAQKEREATKFDQKAKVKLIVFTSPTQANVTYDLMNGTQVVLPGASGQAVLVDSTWKVSKLTFCTLVTLGNNGKAPAGC